MSFHKYLPPTHTQDEVAALLNAKSSLRLVLKKKLKELSFKVLYLRSNEQHALAEILAEFVYDLQNGIGLWSTLELYNREFFSTPLPFILPKNKKMNAPLINVYRLHYLLWHQYTLLKPDVIISPTHRGLSQLATHLTLFINQHIHLKMKNSSVKNFLDGPNDYGWDVKRKLIWLGRNSYFFRDEFKSYIEENGGESIGVTDDFVCQHTTPWSGLGVIDILARLLDINESQQADLQSWYERHLSIYKILRVSNDTLIAENIITKKKYSIRTNLVIRSMVPGSFIYGSLVPWNNEWYWSGEQLNLGRDLYAAYLEDMISDFKKKSAIVYRYAKDLLKEAEKQNDIQHSLFVEHFGDDLVIFPDGHRLAAALQEMNKAQFEKMPEDQKRGVRQRHGVENPWANLNVPHDLLENKTGVGLFYEKSEGFQMAVFFNEVQSGLDKRGVGLSENEQEALRGFITSPNISPSFVKKVASGQKVRSIRDVFLLYTDDDDLVINFLCRKYKGNYFRTYYPNLSVI